MAQLNISHTSKSEANARCYSTASGGCEQLSHRPEIQSELSGCTLDRPAENAGRNFTKSYNLNPAAAFISIHSSRGRER